MRHDFTHFNCEKLPARLIENEKIFFIVDDARELRKRNGNVTDKDREGRVVASIVRFFFPSSHFCVRTIRARVPAPAYVTARNVKV